MEISILADYDKYQFLAEDDPELDAALFPVSCCQCKYFLQGISVSRCNLKRTYNGDGHWERAVRHPLSIACEEGELSDDI